MFLMFIINNTRNMLVNFEALIQISRKFISGDPADIDCYVYRNIADLIILIRNENNR
jgi:hypothetical protein